MKVTDEMVQRFLNWRLPEDFGPDCGISFDGRKPDQWNPGGKGWPVGTNLLTAVQARAMLEHVLGAVPDSGLIDEARRLIGAARPIADEGTEGFLPWCLDSRAWCAKVDAAPRSGCGTNAPASTSGAFTPTHEHAEGGRYKLLGHGKMKGGVGSEWEPCVFYTNAEGAQFATDLLRWNARFTPISATQERKT